MPSKLYGAPAAGRLVVFIGDPAGDTARIVRAGPGLVALPRRCRRWPHRSGRCATIRRASRAWAPPPGAPTTAPERPASTPGPRLRAAARPAEARPLPQAAAE